MTFSTTITYDTNSVKTPLVVANILENETLNDTGTSGAIYIGGSTHLLLIVTLGTETGTADVTFKIQPVNAAGTQVGSFSYDTASLTAAGVTGKAVDEASTTPLGDYVAVVWTGTLTAEHYFAASSVKLIAK
jgi:hypothetical protein